MEFYRYSFLFFFGGLCGWVLELFFRRIVHHKWVNPGFLNGPFLPLYGFGVVGFYLFSNVIPWNAISSMTWLNYIIEIICIGTLMTLIEYIAGLIFIKGMKIKLWDYSTRPGNIQGIICPLFSFIWTLVGVFYLFVLNPSFVTMSSAVISDNLVIPTCTIIGVGFGVIFVDFGYSASLATKIRKGVSNSKLVVEWESMKESFLDYSKKVKGKISWAFPFAEKFASFPTMLGNYIGQLNEKNQKAEEEHRARLEEKKQKIEKKLKIKMSKKEKKEK